MADKAVERKESVAVRLRTAREENGLGLDSVAKDICVRRCYLQAIEEGDFSSLPEKTFAVGFVKSYAKALGLDPKEVAAGFKQERQEWLQENANNGIDASDSMSDAGQDIYVASAAAKAVTVKAASARQGRLPGWLAPLIGLGGAAMSWAFLSNSVPAVTPDRLAPPAIAETVSESGLQQISVTSTVADTGQAPVAVDADRASTLAAAADEVQQQAPEEAPSSFAAVALFTPAANASSNVRSGASIHSIELAASEDSWIKLSYEDGTELWSGVLRAGQTYRPELDGDVFLTTSNAGGISLSHDGARLGPLGARGDVLESLALNTGLFGATDTTPQGAALSVESTGSTSE